MTVGSGVNQRSETRTVNFSGKDVYLNQKTYLIGGAGGNPAEMPAGKHRFDFACELPARLPSSHETAHRCGHIRYYVEAVLDVPWRFNNKSKLEFKVVHCDDLNNFPQLKTPLHCEEIKQFCCFCCASEPLFLTMALPFTGFVPGQKIPVTVTYNNRSDVKVNRTKITLTRFTKLTR